MVSRQSLAIADKTAPIGLLQHLRSMGPVEDIVVLSLYRKALEALQKKFTFFCSLFLAA